MNQNPLVATDTQGSGVDEADSGTSSQQDFLDENGQGKQYFLFKFYKTVNSYRRPNAEIGVSDVCTHTPCNKCYNLTL